MANLPIELIEEILVKLRVKDLLPFKCVCKSWLSLIRSRRFIDRHYSNNSNQVCQLIRLYHRTHRPARYFYGFYPMDDANRRFLRYEEIKFHPNSPFCNDVVWDLMGPVKGIFCIIFISGDIALSNPAIGEIRPLPRSPLPPPLDVNSDSVYEYEFGFGIDPLCGNLKLIALFSNDSSNPAHVYDSITDSWKTIETQRSYEEIRWVFNHTFVNGVYYWFADLESAGFGILAFDMRSENFYQIEIPDLPYMYGALPVIVGHGDSMAVKLGVSTGCEICDCMGDKWEFDHNHVGSLCRSTNLGDHRFVGGLWVWGKDGFGSEISLDQDDWILPSTWQWIARNHSFSESHYRMDVSADHTYSESLVSIKREGEGEDDAIRAFLRAQTTNTRRHKCVYFM